MLRPMDRSASAWGVALAGMAALAAAMGIGRFAFTPLLPMMSADLGLGVAQGGWLASANYAGYLAGALAAVWLRIGARTVIVASLALIAAVTLGMGFTTNFAAWMALRAIAGLASAWVLVFGASWCLERLGRLDRPALGSVVFSGVGAGIALAGAMCLVLMRLGAAAAEAWIALGVAAFVLGALAWPMLAGESAPAVQGAAAPSLRWTRENVLLVACYGVFGFGYIVPATFVPAMARQLVPDPAVFGWSWPVFGAAAFASTLAVSGLIAMHGNRRVWILGVVIMAAGVAAPAISPGLPAVMFSALCVGGTFMVVTMAGMQEARRIGGAQARSLMAAMTAAFAAGQIAGPLAVSAFAAAGTGMNTVLAGSAVLLLASAVALGCPVERSPNEALPE